MPCDLAVVSDMRGKESVPSLSDVKILFIHVVMHPSIQMAAVRSYCVLGSGLSAEPQKRHSRQKPHFKELML